MLTGGVERYEYNADGLVTDMIYSDGTRESYMYDEYQNKSGHTDTRGHTTQWEYDSLCNLLEGIRSDGTRIHRLDPTLPMVCK
ncbi:hypothetical protein B4V02_06900 [Paenibacillus kribbensis]|uniref:Type IV secretion protein Rhs n=1 Tax=Paenibacillus kribbensis TaxID=172713 RepID=A0A222WJQ9_9BACL|nr:hypothetical protein B4V02_06900 [Paenibacillus kribbensis]